MRFSCIETSYTIITRELQKNKYTVIPYYDYYPQLYYGLSYSISELQVLSASAILRDLRRVRAILIETH